MEHWYFETSAVNWFMHDRTINDAIATKQLQTEKGMKLEVIDCYFMGDIKYI